MHHRPGGLLRGSLRPRLQPLLRRGGVGGGCGSSARPGPLTPAPPAGTRPPPAGQPPSSHPPIPAEPTGRGGGGSSPPDGCCRALLLISLYIRGRERRVGRHCCQWRLLTQIIIIKKNRYSWVLAEYGNYYYCRSRLEIIILKARRVQLPRCFE